MRYQACKGQRIKSYKFIDIIPSKKQNEINKLWWLQYHDGSGEWIGSEVQIWELGYLKSKHNGKLIRYLSNSGPKTKSLKAFRRRLKQWSGYLPKGTEFTLMSRYIGYDITTKIK